MSTLSFEEKRRRLESAGMLEGARTGRALGVPHYPAVISMILPHRDKRDQHTGLGETEELAIEELWNRAVGCCVFEARP